jgi:hypothetical protein
MDFETFSSTGVLWITYTIRGNPANRLALHPKIRPPAALRYLELLKTTSSALVNQESREKANTPGCLMVGARIYALPDV